MFRVPHPIDDPDLVSYHRHELRGLLPQLERALDCWNVLSPPGDTNNETKAKYLPREQAEPTGAYKARLGRTSYSTIYRDSIRSYAGLLSRFQLIDAPPSMEENKGNVDQQGSSVQAFTTILDELTLRDGGAFVMVDMMPATDATNYYDELQDGRRPFLVSIPRADVINWSTSMVGGREYINYCVFRQLRSTESPDSAFGTTIEPVYHVLRPGSVQTFAVRRVKGTPHRWENVPIDPERATDIPVVPVVWYGATSPRFAQGEVPMNGLAELSIEHFQKRSDLHELLHKCALPVPVRKGAPLGADGKPSPLVIGPNTAVDLSGEPGSGFSFAEPTGKSLERHQQEIVHTEELMDRCSLNFLYGANVKTATEASLRASQVAASIAAMVRNKVSMFATLVQMWAWYAGEQGSITRESGLAMNDSLVNRPLGASEIAQLVNLFSQGLLSRQTVLDELQRGGVIDPDLVVEEELARIEQDYNDNIKKQQQAAERKLKQDVKRSEEMPSTSPAQGPPASTGRPPVSEANKAQKAAANAQ